MSRLLDRTPEAADGERDAASEQSKGRRRRIVVIAGTGLLALLLAAAILQATLPPAPVKSDQVVIPPGGSGIPVRETFRLPAEIGALQRFDGGKARISMISDGDLPSENQPMWVVAAGPAVARIDVVNFTDRPAKPRARVARRFLAHVPGIGAATLDLTRWNQKRKPEDLVLATQTPRGIRVEIRSPRQGFRVLERGFAPAPLLPGRTRTIAMARWTLTRPDLFVIDDARGHPTNLRVFSGESDFRRMVLSADFPLFKPKPGWVFDVATLTSPLADVVLFKRLGLSGQAEAHMLSGEGDFRFYPFHEKVDAPVSSFKKDYLVTGTRYGQPAIYSVNMKRSPPVLRMLTLPIRPEQRS